MQLWKNEFYVLTQRIFEYIVALYLYTILICCSYISGNKYVIFKLDYQKKRILRLTKGLAMSRMSYKTIVLFSGTLAERAGLESVL